MTSKKLLLAGLVAALGMAGSVQAATVTLTPTISAVLNADFTPVDPAPSGTTLDARPGDYYLLQVDVQVATSGLGGTAVGFANTAFNTSVTGQGAVAYSDDALGIPAWNADNPQFDSNGAAPGGIVSKWDINSDDGANKNDLNGVILAGVTKGFGPVASDIRRTLTQGDGAHAGTFYIKLSGEPGSSATAAILADFGASTYDSAGVSTTAGNSAVGGSTATYQVAVPEPSTVALLGLGSVLLAFARKRR